MDSKSLFEILAREHSPALLAFLRTAVRDPGAVDDLYQETLLTAWRKLDSFDRHRSFAAWLRGIAGNLVLAHYRQQRKSEPSLDPSTLSWLQDRFDRLQELPGDTWHDKLAALRQCVDRLPDHYRSSVEARYYQQQSLEESAQHLNVALAALKKRLLRAKSMLADCLEQKLEQLEWGT